MSVNFLLYAAYLYYVDKFGIYRKIPLHSCEPLSDDVLSAAESYMSAHDYGVGNTARSDGETPREAVIAETAEAEDGSPEGNTSQFTTDGQQQAKKTSKTALSSSAFLELLRRHDRLSAEIDRRHSDNNINS